MPKLPERKAGIVSCSCEELAEGTVSRLASLKVLQELRPANTVTICLPLFLAGGEGDRAFARFHPTITVDGCDLRCAARGTEMYSGKPAASIVITELAAERGLEKIEGRRDLNEAGQQAVEITAQRLAELVDQVLGTKGRPASEEAGVQESKTATCSCGSGIPVSILSIGSNTTEVVAFPLICENLYGNGLRPENVGDELLNTVKIYNYIPPDSEAEFRDVLAREYVAFCSRKAAQ